MRTREASASGSVRPAADADRNNDLSGPKGHVITKVLEELGTELADRGLDSARTQGLDVTTTISRVAQDAAVAAVQEVVGANDEDGAVKVVGLMTMPPFAEDPETSRPHFAALRELAQAHGLEHLSMGTSQDFAVAAAEGATIVRIGTSLYT